MQPQKLDNKRLDDLAYCPFITKCECFDYEDEDCTLYWPDAKCFHELILKETERKYERKDL
jgi:hypothetical protein